MNRTDTNYSELDSALPAESNLSISEGGLYIHIAFCRKKCIYCDFYSIGERKADWHGYVDALIEEFHFRTAELPSPLRTVYIGGGTPSLMPSGEFLRLCDAIAPYAKNVVEFTLEVNPDDVTPEKLNVWKGGGVNRLSMGVQSFNDDILESIRRRHNAEAAVDAYYMAKGIFGNISIDLIFGIPGQTPEMWKDDIRKAVYMKPEHISAYSLMYEPETALTLLRDRGEVTEAPEDVSETMMKILIQELSDCGYDHYEISNFALPGFRSSHNSSYWHGKPYLGLGPSAHSYDGNRCRSANKADLGSYLRHWSHSASSDGLIIREYLSDEELLEEYIMTRLRTKEGINLEDFRRRFGNQEYLKLLNNSEWYLKSGSLSMQAGQLSISESAVLISDSIILALA